MNKLHEKVLANTRFALPSNMLTPLESAINTILRYLKKKDAKILDGYGLAQAERTMKVIWKTKTVYER